MAEGRVKDPEGHQSPQHAFGYLQRLDGQHKWKDKDDYDKLKVIPYFNRTEIGGNQPIHKKPDEEEVKFESRTAYICAKQGEKYIDIGDIGVAVLSTQTELLNLLNKDPEKFS